MKTPNLNHILWNFAALFVIIPVLSLPLQAIDAGTYDMLNDDHFHSKMHERWGMTNGVSLGLDRLVKGDFNGDGIDDLIFGDRYTQTPDNHRGYMWIYLGRPNIPERVGIIPASNNNMASTQGTHYNDPPYEPDLVFRGRTGVTACSGSQGDLLGDTLAAGDINNDGFDDILVVADGATTNGCGNANDTHTAYVIFGDPDMTNDSLGVDTIDLDPARSSTADLFLSSEKNTNTRNLSVALGDVNGDGFDDILIGRPSYNGPGGTRNDAGDLIIVFGRANFASKYINILQEYDVRILGARQGDRFGTTLATGDINEDGYDDILVGAPHVINDVGSVYLFYGRDSMDWGWSQTVSGNASAGTNLNRDNNTSNEWIWDAELALKPNTGFIGSYVDVVTTQGAHTYINKYQIRDIFSDRMTLWTNLVHTPQDGDLMRIRLMDTNYGDYDLEIEGERLDGLLGTGVALSDVNRDGKADMLMAAAGMHLRNPDRDDAGKIYVFITPDSGRFGPRGTHDVVPTDATRQIGNSGMSFSPLKYPTEYIRIVSGPGAGQRRTNVFPGFVNNLFTVNRPWQTNPVINNSVFEVTTLSLNSSDQIDEAEVEIWGASVTVTGGRGLSPWGSLSTGDANADNINDVLMTNARNTKYSYVVFGSTAWVSDMNQEIFDLGNPQAGQEFVKIFGAGPHQNTSRYGPQIVAGDFNGDGLSSEIAIASAYVPLDINAHGAIIYDEGVVLMMDTKSNIFEIVVEFEGKRYIYYHRADNEGVIGPMIDFKVELIP